MSGFGVWAPDAEQVDVVMEDRRLAMERTERGWWSLDLADAPAGTRYRFSIDGGPARSDPRSPWQPDGIEGPSATVDHGSFVWGDGSWGGARLASAVIYECHIGTFTPDGTFDSAIARLDHLVDLGITAVEILPVAEGSGDRGWGYDGVLLWAPHHAYGGPAGFKRLIDACHQRGLAVVLDVVYNHFGPAGNYLGEFGPYFTDRYRTPWGDAVNFDGAGSEGVRDFLIENALMWFVDYHVDGLRLDAVHAIVDASACHVLEQLAIAVTAAEDHLDRNLWLIAESDRNDPLLVRSRESGGYGLDATWNDDFHHALHGVLTSERDGYYEDFGTIEQLVRSLREGYVFSGHWSPFRQRRHGRPFGGLPATRLVVCLQNHDQIGNRAVGERSSVLMSYERLQIAAAVLACGPFVPMLFQGEEWASNTPFQYFTDHHDAELGQAVSEGRTHEFSAFGWSPDDVPDPQDRATFQRSKLDWSELDDKDHRSMLEWHRALLALRAHYSELTDGRFALVSVTFDEQARWFCLHRGRVVLAVNLSSSPQAMLLPYGAEFDVALSGRAGAELSPGAVVVPPDGVAVLTARP